MSKLAELSADLDNRALLVVRDPLFEDVILDACNLEEKDKDFYLKFTIDFKNQEAMQNMYESERKFEILFPCLFISLTCI